MLTLEEKRLNQEYIIADITYPNKSNQIVTLIPTAYIQDEVRKITLKPQDWITWGVGNLVTLTNKNKIKLRKYDMDKCDIMLVTGVRDIKPEFRDITFVGKKFGCKTLVLNYEPIIYWHIKFMDTNRGDRCLVRPYTPYERKIIPDNENEYQILRNFTTEKMIRDFFLDQQKH